MKKHKILALALAGALACPQVAFAARDGEGMEYTSASEGFYGSLRTHFSSNGGKDDNNASIDPGGSRLGVRGTLDLGHGLTGVYRYEWSVSSNNGDNPGNTRLHHVGLKGSFGEAQFGSLWENDYNWVTAATDIATTGSGNFAPHFRRANSLQYTSPDLNGFQGSFRVMMDGGVEPIAARAASCSGGGTVNSAGNGCTGGTNPVFSPAVEAVAGSENVDEWALSAKYGVRGFTVAGAYEVNPDGAKDIRTSVHASDAMMDGTKAKEDATFWAVRGGYSQDNWAVNAWYGVENTSDTKSARVLTNASNVRSAETPDDTKIFSVSGNITIGKVALVVIHENKEYGYYQAGTMGDSPKPTIMKGNTDSATIFNVDYNFTSKSRAYLAYIARDNDTKSSSKTQVGAANPNQPSDEIRIGFRLDF